MKNQYLTDQQLASLVDAIQIAENMTSGEIRVHIDANTDKDNANTAWEVFQSLNMHQTKERNAVLFHVNFEKKYLTIIGDEGIHDKVNQHFWDKLHDEITAGFVQRQYFKAIYDGIIKTGKELKIHFPVKGNHTNELSNEITFS